MERYDSYKDSGVDWIGDIPKNWSVNRVETCSFKEMKRSLTKIFLLYLSLREGLFHN